jgi:hypothetical protein
VALSVKNTQISSFESPDIDDNFSFRTTDVFSKGACAKETAVKINRDRNIFFI